MSSSHRNSLSSSQERKVNNSTSSRARESEKKVWKGKREISKNLQHDSRKFHPNSLNPKLHTYIYEGARARCEIM